MQLVTDRLILRHWRESDFNTYARFFEDAVQTRFIGGACTPNEAWRRMAAVAGHWTLMGFGLWAVESRSDKELVGCVGVQYPKGWPEHELGYWIGAEHQGKGYATEACVCAREHAYTELGFKTLVSFIDPDNIASIRVAEKLGAQREQEIELLDFGAHCVYRHPGRA